MDVHDGVLSGSATIVSTTGDELTDVETLNTLDQFPSLMHNVVGDLWVESVEVVWQTPTAERSPDSTAVRLDFEWTQALDPRLGRVSVQYNPPAWVGQASAVAANVTLEARTYDGWSVTDYSPVDAVVEQDEDSVVLVFSYEPSTMTFTNRDRGPNPSPAATWLDGLGIPSAAWLAVPALAFFIGLTVSRSRKPQRAVLLPREWRGIGPMLAVLVIIATAPLILGEWTYSLLELIPPPLDLVTGFALGLISLAPCGTIASGWTLAFHRMNRAGRVSRVVAYSLAFAGSLVVGATAFLVFNALNAEFVSPGDVDEGSTWLLVGLAVCLFIVGGAILIAAMGGRWAALGGVAIAGPALFVVYANIALFGISSGPPLAWHAVSVCVTVFSVSALAMYVARIALPGTSARRRRILIVGAVAVLTLALSAPLNPASTPDDSPDLVWDPLWIPLLVGIVILVVAGLIRARPTISEWSTYAATFIVLTTIFRPTMTYYGVPVAAIVGVVLLWLTGFERDAPTGRPAYSPSDAEVRRSIRLDIDAAGSRRLGREYSNALARKVADGQLDAAEFEVARRTVLSRDGEAVKSQPDRMAFAWGGTPRPLQRGAVGALVATLAGLPFSIQPILDLFDTLDDAAGVATFIAFSSAFVGLRFALYGFTFGLLMPVLRGRTAIGKAARLAVTVATTEALVILVPYSWDQASGEALLLRLAQLAVVFLALGAYFDFRSLRAGGYGLTRLSDLYGVNRVIVWSSGAVTGVISAAVAALFSSASEILIERLLPW
jgi:hypothetical protein